MPAGYAHLMITNEAKGVFNQETSIDAKLLAYTETHLSYLHLGSVSPDYPYLDLGALEKGQKLWADHMHYEFTAKILKRMAEKLLEEKQTKGMDHDGFILPFCWTLGYLSHVTADSVVHPFIYDVVGSYDGHKDEHRNLEMIQDSFIYKKMTGEEIDHSKLLTSMRNCSDPQDGEKMHPILSQFWGDRLQELFPHDYPLTPPNIDHWHKSYLEMMGFASAPPFLGRVLGTAFNPEAPYTYKQTTDMDFAEKALYQKEWPLPNGDSGTYEKDVFPHAVKHVAEKWILLGKGITLGNVDEFLVAMVDCDLDTGLKTSEFVYW